MHMPLNTHTHTHTHDHTHTRKVSHHHATTPTNVAYVPAVVLATVLVSPEPRTLGPCPQSSVLKTANTATLTQSIWLPQTAAGNTKGFSFPLGRLHPCGTLTLWAHMSWDERLIGTGLSPAHALGPLQPSPHQHPKSPNFPESGNRGKANNNRRKLRWGKGLGE